MSTMQSPAFGYEAVLKWRACSPCREMEKLFWAAELSPRGLRGLEHDLGSRVKIWLNAIQVYCRVLGYFRDSDSGGID